MAGRPASRATRHSAEPEPVYAVSALTGECQAYEVRARAIAQARQRFAGEAEAARLANDYKAWAAALNRCQWAIDDAEKEYRHATRKVAA